MSPFRLPVLGILCIAALVCLAHAAADDLAATMAGAPAPSANPARPAVAAPEGLDDALSPLPPVPAELDAAPALTPLPSPDVAVPETAGIRDPDASGSPLSEKLASIPPASRARAAIELEPLAPLSPGQSALARAVVSRWSRGLCDEALADLSRLEASGAALGLGISWAGGSAAEPLRNGDVRIGGARVAARTACVDYHAATGNLFSAVQWGSYTGTSNWTMNLSTDEGATWAETYNWTSSVGIIDVDATVVAGYVYVAYIVGDATDEVRTRRCLATNGSIDDGYGYQVALDAGANTFGDVAVASNADDYDNRIYIFAIQSDHVLRYAWDVATDGTTFTDVTPPATADVFYGLDATWDHGLECTDFLYVSYVGTDQYIHVLGRSESAWTAHAVASSTGPFLSTSISAYGPTIICAYEMPMTNGTGIEYRINYNCGEDTWGIGTLATPDGTTVTGYYSPSVDARTGLGTGITYQAEMGELDAVLYQYRLGYAPGMWTDPLAFNDLDVVTGTPTALSPITPAASGFNHGAIYIGTQSIPYFDRLGLGAAGAPAPGESGAALAWLPATPNPCRDRTTIRFELPEPGRAKLELYDVAGRLVATIADEDFEAGTHALAIEPPGEGSRLLYCRLTVGTRQVGGRILLIR